MQPVGADEQAVRPASRLNHKLFMSQQVSAVLCCWCGGLRDVCFCIATHCLFLWV
jgi:hypothetical protein